MDEIGGTTTWHTMKKPFHFIIHEEDRKEYYSALEAWDRMQDLVPLRDFLMGQTEKTWKKQLERAEGKK